MGRFTPTGRFSSPVVACVALLGCATAPKPIVVQPVLERADNACARLRQTTLEQPVRTPIEQSRRAIGEALQAKDKARALVQANALLQACRTEARQRSDVVALRRDLAPMRAKLSPARVAQFERLVGLGDYGNAIVCGEGLLQGVPVRCDETMSGGVRQPYRPSATVSLERPRRGGTRLPREVAARPVPPAAEPATEGVSPAPFGAPEAGAVAATTPAEQVDGSRRRRWPLWFWGTAGVSAAALLGGGILAGLASARHADLEGSCPDCSRADVDGGKRMALAADVMFGLGAAAAIGAAVLWFVRPAAPERAGRATTQAGRARGFGGVSLGPAGAAAIWTF